MELETTANSECSSYVWWDFDERESNSNSLPESCEAED